MIIRTLELNDYRRLVVEEIEGKAELTVWHDDDDGETYLIDHIIVPAELLDELITALKIARRLIKGESLPM